MRNRQRPRYGFYVDHIVDTFAAFFLMGGLALSACIHPAIAFGMLIAFLMLSIEAYLTTYQPRKYWARKCVCWMSEVPLASQGWS